MSKKNYAENLGKKIIIILVLTDLTTEIKGDFVFVLKAKTRILNVLCQRKLFDKNKCCNQFRKEMI